MLRLRLNLVKFILQCVMFLLPACAFGIAAYLGFFTDIFPPAPASPNSRAYVVLLFFASIAWALALPMNEPEIFGMSELPVARGVRSRTRRIWWVGLGSR